MKFKILPSITVTCVFIFVAFTHGIAQPKIQFSASSHLRQQPIIIGKTVNNYYCIYPGDSIPQLVIYNNDLREQSRVNWNSVITPDPLVAYQAFTLNNNLVLLLQQKVGDVLNISCIILDEKGNRVSEKTLATDSTYRGSQVQAYDVEMSKNEKYILLYRGAKINTENFLFKGYLFDSNWSSIKQFAIPIEKNETEESWDGAMVDIEGNIHTLVYTAADSWKLGSRIRIHTLAKGADEVRSEQIEVLKKRLLNYSLSEDTGAHLIQLQATLALQHDKDALGGISFISIPYSRDRKIAYTVYNFTREQKKMFAKNITADKKLLVNTDIEFPSSFKQDGSFFTTITVHGDYPESKKQNPDLDKIKNPKLDELYLSERLYSPSNDVLARHDNLNGYQGYDQGQFLKSTSNWLNQPGNYSAVTERLILLKNNHQGILESSATHLLNKAAHPFYDDNFYSIVKDDSQQLLGYLMDVNGPGLYLLTQNEKAGRKKIEASNTLFILLSNGSRIDETSSLFPYVDAKTGEYGLTRIIF